MRPDTFITEFSEDLPIQAHFGVKIMPSIRRSENLFRPHSEKIFCFEIQDYFWWRRNVVIRREESGASGYHRITYTDLFSSYLRIYIMMQRDPRSQRLPLRVPGYPEWCSDPYADGQGVARNILDSHNKTIRPVGAGKGCYPCRHRNQ